MSASPSSLLGSLPDDYHAWSVGEKDAYWQPRRSPEHQAARERMAQYPADWRQYRCKRHPDLGLVLSINPDLLYCYLCMQSKTYDQLVKVDMLEVGSG